MSGDQLLPDVHVPTPFGEVHLLYPSLTTHNLILIVELIQFGGHDGWDQLHLFEGIRQQQLHLVADDSCLLPPIIKVYSASEGI